MTTSALSPITVDASELERVDRFADLGLVHIEQLSALCRLLTRVQPDDEELEQSETDFVTVTESMLPMLDAVRVSLEEIRSMLPQSQTEATNANEAGTLNQAGMEIPAPLAVRL